MSDEYMRLDDAVKRVNLLCKWEFGKAFVELECSPVVLEDATSVLARKIDEAMEDIKKMLEKKVK